VSVSIHAAALLPCSLYRYIIYVSIILLDFPPYVCVLRKPNRPSLTGSKHSWADERFDKNRLSSSETVHIPAPLPRYFSLLQFP
jgi:hypothetical protein